MVDAPDAVCIHADRGHVGVGLIEREQDVHARLAAVMDLCQQPRQVAILSQRKDEDNCR